MSSIGFSLVGLIVSLAILAPSLLLVVAPPRDAPSVAVDVPVGLTLLERIGQVGCVAVPILAGAHGHVDAWLVPVGMLVAAYYGLWARYLFGGRRFARLCATPTSTPPSLARAVLSTQRAPRSPDRPRERRSRTAHW